MEKKAYVTPEMEVVELENDAILTSNGEGTGESNMTSADGNSTTTCGS